MHTGENNLTISDQSSVFSKEFRILFGTDNGELITDHSLSLGGTMPIYEYRCTDCKKRLSLLSLSVSQAHTATCTFCGSVNLERLMSRFASPKSEEARLEAFSDPSNFGDVDENDPQSMARFMKKLGPEMGEDMGDDFDEAVEEAGSGLAESDSSDLM